MRTSEYGKACEIKAKQYLINKGYQIVITNYKNKIGEIDIICLDGDVLVFVEVKGRMSRKFGDPVEAVDSRKQYKIRQVATVYLMRNKLFSTNCRFDVVSVLGDTDEEIRHIINAF